jgi:hypothetical protein
MDTGTREVGRLMIVESADVEIHIRQAHIGRSMWSLDDVVPYYAPVHIA